MTKSKIISLAAVAFLFAFAVPTWAYALDGPREYDPTVPEWMRTFYQGDLGGPEYRGPWVYGINRLGVDKGVDEGFIPGDEWQVAYRSRGDGSRVNFWNSGGKQLAGLSFSNDIAKWLEPPEGMTRSIRYSIVQDWSGTGGPNNSDIMEIDEHEVETSAFDFKADLAPHRGYYDHGNAIMIGGAVNIYRGIPTWSANQSDEDAYFSAGKTGQFDDGTHMLDYGRRINSYWGGGDGSGYGTLGSARFDTYGAQSGENFSWAARYSDGRWWSSVVIDEATYWLYLQNSDGSIRDYDADIYPEDSSDPGNPESASGYPIVWHDDYELELTYSLELTYDDDDLPVTTYGEAGRWVVERASTTYWESGRAYAHAGDVMSETRTYNPIMNGGSDGPESAYEWLYNASGDMHVPDGTPPEGGWSDDPYDRALDLIGRHPAYPDDDTFGECETNDWYIGKNIIIDPDTYNDGGVVSQQYFEYAWKIAGKLLGDRFWEDGYVWSNELGVVATRMLVENDFVQAMATHPIDLPVMTWNSTTERWEFPTSNGYYDTDKPTPWAFMDHYADTAVAGHEAINNFLRYVMDIDALVIQDVNGNGVYDEEEDYILFSLVDDGLFTKMLPWGAAQTGTGTDTPFEGEYFDGDVIFLYHNCEVTTYFDPNTGIFFGEAIGTTPGFTLWSIPGLYDMNALDIGLVPEPTTMILVIGAGLALGAGVLRRKLR
jgi:hypothetical protein